MMRTTVSCAVAAIGCVLLPLGAARAAEPAASVGALFSRFDKAGSPGCAVSVMDHGQAVLERGFGSANLETGTPITPDTVFDVGSTSKQFTAASVLLLIQDGKLSLDDDIRRYLPELPDYGTRISIRQLLNHVSGVRDYVSLLSFADVDPADLSTQAQALEMLARQKGLNNAPGAAYLYSNSNYLLAASIVERVSGMSLREFAAKRLFAPLGMTHTQINDDFTRQIPGRASGYAPAEGGWARAESHWNEVGDGGVWTTVRDLELWDRNFAAPVVGGADFAVRMTEVGALNDGAKLHYALGLMVDERRGLKRVQHGGATDGFRSELVRFPEIRLSVAVLCNAGSIDASDLANATADLWLPVQTTATATTTTTRRGPPADARTVNGWAGVYRSPDSGALRTVEAAGGKASIKAFGGRFELKPVDAETAELVDGPVVASFRFHSARDGAPAGLIQKALDRETKFERIELAHPSVDAMAAYAGSYDCPELGRTWRLEIKDGKLTRRDPRGDVWRFDTLDQDRFGYGNLTMTFRRAGARIDGATLDIGRARGMACKRTAD